MISESSQDQQKKLEAMLLEGLKSEFTPLTKSDFKEIKKRDLERLRNQNRADRERI